MLHTIFWASSYQKYLEIQQLVDDEKVRSEGGEDERGVGEQSHPPDPPDKNEHEMVMIMSAIVLFNAISWSLSNIIIIVGEQSHPPDPPGDCLSYICIVSRYKDYTFDYDDMAG